MVNLISRDVEYTHDRTLMNGYLCAPAGAQALPGVVVVHDAFGLNADMIHTAERYAGLGYAVFAPDVWGERTTPAVESEIGPLIGGMVSDRTRWMARIAAAREAFAAQPEVDISALAIVGYCFGGSTALEFLRTGGDIRGAVSIHGGLDLLDDDWDTSTSSARVLVCTGADDPMATAPMRAQLESLMSAAGVDWELDLYSDTKHAFTNPKSDLSSMPDVVAYNPRSSARAWEATKRFLGEIFSDEGLPEDSLTSIDRYNRVATMAAPLREEKTLEQPT